MTEPKLQDAGEGDSGMHLHDVICFARAMHR